MTKIIPVTLVFTAFSLFSCTSGKRNESETTPTNDQPETWMLLLAGSTLDQWQMYSQDSIKGWSLIDGELHASGAGWDAGEDIITKETFANFDLSLEWKVAPENSSGIFFYVQNNSDQPIYESAPEYQVMDDKGWPQQMMPNQYTAANYAMHAPVGAEVKPAGEWNTTRITVNYPHVEHWLNGVKVVEYDFGSEDWENRKASGKWADVPNYGKAKSGHIGLQNAGKVVYRNLKIREL
ncbi:DUF1080 domain-containing protein [uncultured Imperialibacter sp.]|uniref:3-keto-disaccharide hydrolase n=1 Tax=uncultured Imperialibacter sp. TaxID=1672639 RepID=UPI0030D7C367|tara:strand:+ start:22818 stop:23528 length:711 start_codon:yes stop_codon:yes gene_type:complete